MKKYLALDVGGSSVKYAVMTENLEFLEHGKVLISTESKEELFGPLKELFDQYHEGIEGVAMSIPGMLDRHRGFAYTGGAFRWISNMEYAKELEELFGVPVTICNDAKAAAMAEMGYGNLQGIDNAVVIILGTGIGGAVVANGQLLDGKHFSAGEFSSLRGDYLQREEDKGDRFASTNGIRGVMKVMKEYTGLDDIDALQAFRMIREGNEQALAAMNHYCDMLAFHIYNLQVVIDADRFVIGGGISNEPMFIGMVNEAVDRIFSTGRIPRPEVINCRFLSDANLIGAVYNFRELKES